MRIALRVERFVTGAFDPAGGHNPSEAGRGKTPITNHRANRRAARYDPLPGGETLPEAGAGEVLEWLNRAAC